MKGIVSLLVFVILIWFCEAARLSGMEMLSVVCSLPANYGLEECKLARTSSRPKSDGPNFLFVSSTVPPFSSSSRTTISSSYPTSSPFSSTPKTVRKVSVKTVHKTAKNVYYLTKVVSIVLGSLGGIISVYSSVVLCLRKLCRMPWKSALSLGYVRGSNSHGCCCGCWHIWHTESGIPSGGSSNAVSTV